MGARDGFLGSPQVFSMLAPSPFVRVSIPNEPVAHFLLRGSQAHPDKPALIDGSTHRTIT
jgi:hypothetical protein